MFQVEDERNIIIQKAIALADAIKKSKSLVIYTGAGISTVCTATVLVFQIIHILETTFFIPGKLYYEMLAVLYDV